MQRLTANSTTAYDDEHSVGDASAATLELNGGPNIDVKLDPKDLVNTSNMQILSQNQDDDDYRSGPLAPKLKHISAFRKSTEVPSQSAIVQEANR